MYLHCTQKLTEKLQGHWPVLRKKQTGDNDHGLGHWHANIITLAHHNVLLFIHDETLFAFFVADIKVADLDRLDRLFYEGLINTMRGLGYHKEVIVSAAKRAGEAIADNKTHRATLGHLNQYAQAVEHRIRYDGYDSVMKHIWFNSAQLCDRPLPQKQGDLFWPAREMQRFLGFEPQPTLINRLLDGVDTEVHSAHPEYDAYDRSMVGELVGKPDSQN